ncbi:hypothetical protein [Salegentibacter chungangensis]|uniref:Uncharacterized protein n=1 Tax=Salegentibacter chungangensis TaxID=1335724 RepID=A0ABW3NQG4_9FLAO
MTLTKKIFIGIVTIIILFTGFVFWLYFEIVNENQEDEKFNNIEISENLNFEKPIQFLTNRQIDSLTKIKVNDEKIVVIGDGYNGYDFYMWHKPTEKGKLYIKAFELTKNIQLSELELNTRTESEISELGENYKLYTGNSLIYEGTLAHYYPVRFELWFKPKNSGIEKKLTEKKYVIDGWDR